MSNNLFDFMHPAPDEPAKPEAPHKAPSKLSPFEFVNSINKKGEMIDVEEVQRSYDAFMVNRAMSNTFDTVLFANELNILNNMDKVMQYHFYYFGVDRKPTRFGKWNKVEDDAAIPVIQEYYGYSKSKARDVLPLLVGHMDQLKQELEKGGAHGKQRHH